MASEWDFQVLQHPVLPNYSVETGGLEELVALKQCSGEAERGPEQGLLRDQSMGQSRVMGQSRRMLQGRAESKGDVWG